MKQQPPDFSLIETMRFTPGAGIERFSLHMKRLQTSARRLGFEGAERAQDTLADHLGLPPFALEPVLGLAGGTTREGISPTRGEIDQAEPSKTHPPINNPDEIEHKAPSSRLAISPLVGEMAGRPEGGVQARQSLRLRLELAPDGDIAITSALFTLQPPDTVWRVAIAQTGTPSTDPLIRHKTTRRAIYETARAQYPAGEIDEVLLLNEKGELAEGTITNIFVDDGTGRLLTPPISSGCLPGVLRTSLICARKAFNQRLRPEDIVGKALYVGNSLRGLIRAELSKD